MSGTQSEPGRQRERGEEEERLMKAADK